MTKVKTIFIIVLTLTLGTVFTFKGKPADNEFAKIAGSKLVIALDTNHYNYFIKKGYPMGYQLELVNLFAKKQQLDIDVRMVADSNRLEKLRNGEIDILVFSQGIDSLYSLINSNEDISSSIPLDNHVNSVWLSRANQRELNYAINLWTGDFKTTKLYAYLQVKYFKRSYDKLPPQISPFDNIFKKYSAQINWDWRLLASLVYQESMFKTDACSKRGAFGLMQLMPETAKSLGIKDRTSPDENVRIGVKFLQMLNKFAERDSIPNEDKIQFILAGYNAGYGRVEDCRAVAKYKGLNPNKWDEVRTVIPLMRDPTNDIKPYMRRGKFNGTETLGFVKKIMEVYQHYQHFYE